VATAPVAAPVAANPDAAYDRNATANGQQSEEGIRYYG
jgi:hypothetical protein